VASSISSAIDIQVIGDWTFYVNPDTGYVTFEVDGGGVWGPIEGIVTLQPDFETIVDVSILQQEETPGLGGVIAESQYLETFQGKVLVPQFIIAKDPSDNLPNEIDAIVGATNTSTRFQDLLNDDYASARDAWFSQND
jgi:Na+-transporting NADH:ubiquinone oxidoreductase subunit C